MAYGILPRRRSRVCLFRHKQHVVDQEELPAPLSGFDVAVRRFIYDLYTHPTHVYTPRRAPRALACALCVDSSSVKDARTVWREFFSI
jgi:hypothetical protein